MEYNEGKTEDIFRIGDTVMRKQYMSERQARELPKIDIGRIKFYLDLRLNEFRECSNFMNRMNLDDLHEIEGGYLVCFDPNTKNYFEGSKEEFDHRKDGDLIWVKLPTLQQMDPLGFKWLLQEFSDGSPITARPHQGEAYHENESTQLEKILDKAGLLYKTKNHPPLLEKKPRAKSKGKKL